MAGAGNLLTGVVGARALEGGVFGLVDRLGRGGVGEGEVDLVNEGVALGGAGAVEALGGQGEGVLALGQPDLGIGVVPRQPAVAEGKAELLLGLAVHAEEDVGGALLLDGVGGVEGVGEDRQVVSAVLRDRDLEVEGQVGASVEAADIVAAGGVVLTDVGRRALRPFTPPGASGVRRVLGFICRLPELGRRGRRGRVAARREDDLIGGGLLEPGQRLAEAEGERAVLHPQVEFGDDVGLGGVADLAGPRNLLDQHVHGGSEQLGVHVVEADAGLAGCAAEQGSRLRLGLVQRGDALQGVAHAGPRRSDLDGVAGHLAVSVEQPPLTVAPVGLDGGVGQVAVDVPVRDVGVDLRLLDGRGPLDHLAGHRGVVVVRVLVEVDRQLFAAEDGALPFAVPGDVGADAGGIAQLVPGDDLWQGARVVGVPQEVLHLAVQGAGVGAGDPGLRHLALDQGVDLVPGLEVVLRVAEPVDAVVAPLPVAEHVALGLVERHEDDVVLVFRVELEDLVDLFGDLGLEVVQPFLGRAARPLVGETAVDVGHVDVHVAVGAVCQRLDHLQGVGARVLRPVLRLGRDRAQVHAFEQVAGGDALAVDAVQSAGRAAVEGAGGGGEVDGEVVVDHLHGGLDGGAVRGALDGELAGFGVLSGVDGLPGDGDAAADAVGELRVGALWQFRRDLGVGGDVEGGLVDLRDRGQVVAGQAGDLLGVHGGVVDAEVVQFAVQERVPAPERLAEEAGGGVAVGVHDRGQVDLGRGAADGGAVDVVGEGLAVDRGDQVGPLAGRQFLRAGHAHLDVAVDRLDGRAGGGVAGEGRGDEGGGAGVLAEVVDPLEVGAARPLQPGRDRYGLTAAEQPVRDRHVRSGAGAGRAAGQGQRLGAVGALSGGRRRRIGQRAVQAGGGAVGDGAARQVSFEVVVQDQVRRGRR